MEVRFLFVCDCLKPWRGIVVAFHSTFAQPWHSSASASASTLRLGAARTETLIYSMPITGSVSALQLTVAASPSNSTRHGDRRVIASMAALVISAQPDYRIESTSAKFAFRPTES
ncbi:unnamed protein product [Soboliphyme baturini]|uniref:Secreted protein n=1 Tax=Soboliphyme baturini TaxID=241478 RepID=A0A183IF89_9BILA|nr:unnamed protein product [Soboliphyme baturini]